jgi:hypothetical protein
VMCDVRCVMCDVWCVRCDVRRVTGDVWCVILVITAPHTLQAAFVDLEVQVQQQQQQQQSVQQSVLALQQQLSAAQVHAMLKSRSLKYMV